MSEGISSKHILIIINEVDQRNVTSKASDTEDKCETGFLFTIKQINFQKPTSFISFSITSPYLDTLSFNSDAFPIRTN